LLSHIGGSVAVGDPLNAMSFFSTIDQGNGQNVSPGTFNTAALTPSITAAGSYDASNSAAVPLVSYPFSMTEDLTITLSGDSIVNYSSSTTLSPSTGARARVAVAGRQQPDRSGRVASAQAGGQCPAPQELAECGTYRATDEVTANSIAALIDVTRTL